MRQLRNVGSKIVASIAPTDEGVKQKLNIFMTALSFASAVWILKDFSFSPSRTLKEMYEHETHEKQKNQSGELLKKEIMGR